ncbi:MAG: GntR family transcriptional regulator [Victivallales bacterium]|nr:GntR family transcriptional regulator [Victivallales bacterium]
MFDALEINFTENKAYPKYVQLRNLLKSYIAEKRIPADTQLPDILTMCRMAGLSNRSVERAYNLLIEDGICYRRPKKGTFVSQLRNEPAKAMPRICGVLNPSPSALEEDNILGIILNGIREQARKQDVDIIIMAEQSLNAYRESFGDNLLGVIALYWYDSASARELVARHPDMPFVFVNLHIPEFDTFPANITGIFNDDFAGGFAAGDYLFSSGSRKPRVLSIVGADDNYQQRVKGLLRAASYHSVQCPEEAVFFSGRKITCDRDHQEIASEYIRSLTAQKVDFDCIFCTNDLLAAGVAEELEKAGVRKKVRIMGYDNLHPFLSHNWKFSTVAVNFREMGARAIDSLTEAQPLPRTINIAPQLIIR